MEFIVKGQDGAQEGPIDQETLRKWVDIDKVRAETPVRNAMLNNWRQAKDFEFLQEPLAAQAYRLATQAYAKKGKASKFAEKLFGSREETKAEAAAQANEKKLYFAYEYLPRPAGAIIRLFAASFDWALIGAFALLLLAFGMASVYIAAVAGTPDLPEGYVPKTEQSEAAKNEASAPEKLDKTTEARLPSRLDDASKGFHRGSLWTNTMDRKVYACVFAEKGAAL